MAKYQLVQIRLTREQPYYEDHMRVFAEHMGNEITTVQFGKQDSRGAFSITLYDTGGCVPYQKHFITKDEMLGFLVAYNEAKGWYGYDGIKNFI